MLRELRPAVVMLLAFTVITGLIYPFTITGLAQLVFPFQAGGSLITRDHAVIGSALIGQNFATDKYFHGRPSATTDTDPADSSKTVASPYMAAGSTGSNLGPTAKALIDRVTADAAAMKAVNPAPIPVDLITTSASGLDPDITPAAALWQLDRVAKARGVSPDTLRSLVNTAIEPRLFGIVGEPHVNVLKLNLALDAAVPAAK